MKVLSQIATLNLIAQYRKDRDNYNTSSKEVTSQLINELETGTYNTDSPKVAIAGLLKQREREDAKLAPVSQ